MKILLIACVLLALGGCASMSTNSNAVADQNAIAAANTAMTVAKVVARVQTLDCTTAPPAAACVNAETGDTNAQVQAKTTTCLTSIAVNGALAAIQRRLCSQVGLTVPAAKQ